MSSPLTVKEQELENVTTELGNVPHNIRCAFTNLACLKQAIADDEESIRKILIEHSAPEITNISNSMSHVHSQTAPNAFPRYANAKLMLELFEKSDEAKQAVEICQPLLDKIESIKAEIQVERETHGKALHALNEAEEKARIAAEEKLAKDPAVKAAREALEAAQPALVPAPVEHPAPFRGTLKIVDGAPVPA